MIVLDTNVLSELMRQSPDLQVVRTLSRYQQSQVHITSITVFELWHGCHALPDGRRKNDLSQAVAQLLEKDFAGRILPFDSSAAKRGALLLTAQKQRGLTAKLPDIQIAAIALTNGFAMMTRDTDHFAHEGLVVVDPWVG